MGAIVRGHMPRAGDMADLRSERSKRKDAFARKLFAQRLFSRRRRVRRLYPRGDIDRGIRSQEHIRFDGQRGYVLRHRRIRSSIRQYRRSDVRAIPRVDRTRGGGVFLGRVFRRFVAGQADRRRNIIVGGGDRRICRRRLHFRSCDSERSVLSFDRAVRRHGFLRQRIPRLSVLSASCGMRCCRGYLWRFRLARILPQSRSAQLSMEDRAA